MHESDMEMDRLQQDLEARRARLAQYVRVRGVIGLVVAGAGALVALFAAVVALVAAGALEVPSIAVWTDGYGAVAAPFLPGALAFILLRTGIAWWRARREGDADTGCLCG
jgi:hypothetical protein